MGTSESSFSSIWRMNSVCSSCGTTRLNTLFSSTSRSSLLWAPRVVRNRRFCAHGTWGRSLSVVSHTPGSGFFSSSASSATPAITRATSATEILCCLIC